MKYVGDIDGDDKIDFILYGDLNIRCKFCKKLNK